ncbi:MAG: pyruvate, phosphate dikinase [Hyphomicrobiales bacterium]
MTVVNAAKRVYRFAQGAAEGNAGMRALLGGKGANLAQMCLIGLPVPPGFTVTTEVCGFYERHDRTCPDGVGREVEMALEAVGRQTGARFGDRSAPLLVSVRSGAPVSMPGMMDTILNLGLNDETVESLAVHTQDRRFAYDCYRRFIQMYGDVVLGLDRALFEDALEHYKDRHDLAHDGDLAAQDWQEMIAIYKTTIAQQRDGKTFPQDVHEQLWGAIGAVFKSWHNPRAATYRKLNDIPENWGTAVNVQAMVFGNMGERSATGVAFTRNPSTGEKELYGEFLVNAQGEDVVAGLRTPHNMTESARLASQSDKPSLETLFPECFAELRAVNERLESHYRDMQDVEFTIENDTLWLLQTRSGKRTAPAALKIAVDMVDEGLISEREAMMRIEPESLDRLLHPTLDPRAECEVVATGLPASPGAVSGELVFDCDEAEKRHGAGRKVILVRIETSPEDIHGMHAAEGIVTTRGGMTSHAAVVARGMGKPCVAGAGGLSVDYEGGRLIAGSLTVNKGDILTIDGASGRIIKGRVATITPEISPDFTRLMRWSDDLRRLKVRANADTPADARAARDFGAEGIGLCRTEHMFFHEERIPAMREMILAPDRQGRVRALEKILPMQRGDFIEMFEIMAGLPVTIRLLDPPLHEFLPHGEAEIAQAAEAMGVEPDALRRHICELHEFNPMLGHRGVRLAITCPEIARMQARAIFEAAVEVGRRGGEPVIPEIMIPLAAMRAELDYVKRHIAQVAEEVRSQTGRRPQYSLGVMIELPRACLRAGDIARDAEFFSFGTNDLTQMAFGVSRDDSVRFLPDYAAKAIVDHDPFTTLDRDGVGELMKIAAERGRATRKNLKIGICGEHGGDPASIDLCEEIGLDYVSCSPFRVPIARLAAARAVIARNADMTSHA